MRRNGFAAACAILAVVAAFAGCVGTDTSADETVSPSGVPDALLGIASGLPLAPRADASLDAPPAWRLGEWWRIAFSAPLYGIEATVDRVVVGVHGGAYVVGMGGGLDDGVLLLHFPGFGEIDPATLGFDAHDRAFVPLQFPLMRGTTWTTQWYTGVPLEATVTSVEGTVATIRMTGARTIDLEYDAAVGEVRKLDIEGYGGYEVVDHGYGYEGRVTVPAGQDLVFCHGRANLVQAVESCVTQEPSEPRAPSARIELAEGYDRVSFGLFVRDTADAPVGPGVLHIRVTAPDGSSYEATKTPEWTGFALYPYGMADPAGNWEVTALAGGAGLAILEGVAYDVLNVELDT